MAHVEIKSKKGGGHTLIVDGFDLTDHVCADGFRVEIAQHYENPDLVHLVLIADTLDVDLPSSVLTVTRSGA